ncbi:MAG: WD40 repeat domain-containing protein [Planctomycetes bacterium]|nr:WD40 repeat domain-containing protein [Planctomycetota bacterium]
MFHLVSLIAALSVGLVLLHSEPVGGGQVQGAHQAPPAPKSDAMGDPLPKGAVARIGTTRLRNGEPIHSLTVSKDGAILASGGSDRGTSARVWDAKTGKQLLSVDNQGSAVALAPDGQTLVVCGIDAVLRVWDVKSGKETRQITLTGNPGAPGEGARAVAFSPTGDLLAVRESWIGSPPNVGPTLWMARIRLIRFASGETFAHLSTSDDRERGQLPFVFSPDGRMLATIGGEEHCVHLWETATGQLRAKLPKIFGVSLAFSPDRRVLAVGNSEAIRLIDMLTQKDIRALTGFPTKDHYGPGALAFSPDGKYLAGGGTDFHDVIRIWDTATGKVTRQINKQPAYGGPLTFTRDGKGLIAANGPALRQWDVGTGKESILAETPRLELWCAAFSSDGKSLALAGANGVGLYAIDGYKEFKRLDEKWARVTAFMPDDKHLVTAGAKLSLFEISSGKKIRTFEGHKYGVTSVALLDRQTLISGSHDGTVRLWEIGTGVETGRIDSPWRDGNRGPLPVHAVAVVPNSKFLACQSGGNVFLWNTATKQVAREFTGYHWDGYFGGIAVSPDGRLLAGEGHGDFWDKVFVHQIDGGKPARNFSHRADAFTRHWGVSFAFSPDGKILASGSADKSVRLWDVTSGKQLQRFAGHIGGVTRVAFAPDGKSLASTSTDGTALIWDTGRSSP